MPRSKTPDYSEENLQKQAFYKVRREQFAADASLATAEYRQAGNDAVGRMAGLTAGSAITTGCGSEANGQETQEAIPSEALRSDQIQEADR